MSVAILLITHEHIANNLLATANNILNSNIENINAIEVPMDSPVDIITSQAEDILTTLNSDDGLLILTDLVGSTPFNIAGNIKSKHPRATLISGLNLPMLLKLSNYRDLALDALSNQAIIGGQTGIDKHEH